MAEERCNEKIHEEDERMYFYDWEYYRQLLPFIEGKVLDVGCGACMFIKEYIKKPEVKSVLGIDKYMDETYTHDKATYKQVTIPEGIPTDIVFDTIVSTEFVEHIERDQLEPLLEQIAKVMHNDSIFIGSTPNKVSPTSNPFHLYEYTLTELMSIFHNYFSEVEMWDNGQNCTLWKAKL